VSLAADFTFAVVSGSWYWLEYSLAVLVLYFFNLSGVNDSVDVEASRVVGELSSLHGFLYQLVSC